CNTKSPGAGAGRREKQAASYESTASVSSGANAGDRPRSAGERPHAWQAQTEGWKGGRQPRHTFMRRGRSRPSPAELGDGSHDPLLVRLSEVVVEREAEEAVTDRLGP